MRLSRAFAVLQCASIVAASPLFIITAVPDMANGLARRDPKQPPSQQTTTDDGFFGLVSSFFDPPTTTDTPTPAQTLPPPMVASTTAHSSAATSKSSHVTKSTAAATSSTDTESSAPTSTSDSETSAPTSTSDTSTSTSTSSSSTSTPPPSSTTAAVPQTASASASASSSNSNSNGLPTAGIVVLVIFGVIILAAITFVVFRYNPRARAWWVARQERKKEARSWREALDGPGARFSNGVTGAMGVSQLRQRALGEEAAGDVASEKGSTRKSMLTSFFAPSTAKLGNGVEIKRKPVAWGEQTPATSPTMRGSYNSEKTSLAATAAPMGHQTYDRNIPIPPMPAPSAAPQELPSRLSIHAHPDFGLPPTMPAAESGVQKAKRGSDGVYRLN